MDRSRWKVATADAALSAARAAMNAAGSPHADASFSADLLDYVDDGVWLVVPDRGAPREVDVSATVDVVTGAVELGVYRQTTFKAELGTRD